MNTETIEQPAATKKWEWNRDAQTTRNNVATSTFFTDSIDSYVSESENGISITDALNKIALDINKLVEDVDQYLAPEIDAFIDMNRIDQRLVVRKVLHTGYREGRYKIMEAVSTYRTGKKSGTKNYVKA